MITYIEGKLLNIKTESIVLLTGQIGYEIFLPAFILNSILTTPVGTQLSFHIYYHQTEKQVKPILIGFNNEDEKDFFQNFISVEKIGPIKAIFALNAPVCEIAFAIEKKDVNRLASLKGIGKRTAEKIIATLAGKLERFCTIEHEEKLIPTSKIDKDIESKVLGVLTDQLGYKLIEAKALISKASKEDHYFKSPEELLDTILKY